jgi:hypothetical protein
MGLRKKITTMLRKYLNETYNSDTFRKDISEFLDMSFYADVKYGDLLHSCDLSKGNCVDVTEELYKFLKGKGYDDLTVVTLYEPKFDLSSAHSEYETDKNILHEVLQVGEVFVDLTGSQFGMQFSGVRILSMEDIKKEWGRMVINT